MIKREKKIDSVRVVMKMNVEVKRGRGRPKKRDDVVHTIENDMRAAVVRVEDRKDLDKWRSRTRVVVFKRRRRRLLEKFNNNYSLKTLLHFRYAQMLYKNLKLTCIQLNN